MSSEASTSRENSEVNEDLFVLYIWPGDWDLPSLDPECLTALCYLKFTNLKHEIVYEDRSFELFRNEYPQLVYKNETYIGLEKILECLKKARNINFDLNDQNYANMLAQLNYFKEKFIPAFKTLCWLEEENTYTVIRYAYGKHLRFPFSLIKLRRMTQTAHNSILCNYRDSHIKLEQLKQQMINDAKECLNNMSNLLGVNVFTFENQPSLLDAYLFGYLSILNKAPFLSSPLKSQLSICSNLGSLLNRIQKDLFSVETEELEKRKQIERNKIKNSYWYSFISFILPDSSTKSVLDKDEEWEVQKQRILVVSIGLTAMVSYAFAVGLIKFKFNKTDFTMIESSLD